MEPTDRRAETGEHVTLAGDTVEHDTVIMPIIVLEKEPDSEEDDNQAA